MSALPPPKTLRRHIGAAAATRQRLTAITRQGQQEGEPAILGLRRAVATMQLVPNSVAWRCSSLFGIVHEPRCRNKHCIAAGKLSLCEAFPHQRSFPASSQSPRNFVFCCYMLRWKRTHSRNKRFRKCFCIGQLPFASLSPSLVILLPLFLH